MSGVSPVTINTSVSSLSDSSESQFCANRIKFNGIKFVTGKAVLLSVLHDMPSFGVVHNIYVDNMCNVELIVRETEHCVLKDIIMPIKLLFAAVLRKLSSMT
jgi:hypothetical protein